MSKSKKSRSKNTLFPGLEDFDDQNVGDFATDPSLEAELMELMGGTGISSKKPETNMKKPVKPVAVDPKLLKLDVDDDLEDELDENDPELLAELNDFLNEDEEDCEKKNVVKSTSSSSDVIIKLENLHKMYQEAIKQSKDANKTRRFERSIKQIEEFLQKARKGQPVNESEFPPEVHVNTNAMSTSDGKSNRLVPSDIPVSEPPHKSPRIQPVKIESVSNDKPATNNYQSVVLKAMADRQNEYKVAALEAKSKDIELAKGLMIIYKQFEEEIKKVKAGEPFDIEDLPPPPSEFSLSMLAGLNDTNAESEPSPPQPPAQVKPLGEELKLRREFFATSLSKAKAEENNGKIRRFERVLQQYDDAIKAFSKKLSYDYSELTVPPGKPPLTSTPTAFPNTANKEPPVVSKPVSNYQSKSTKELLARQAEFRTAALKAKQSRDLSLAKELLRQSKGFDQMIAASEAGLPVNLAGLPTLPSEANNDSLGFEIIDTPNELIVDGNVTKESVLKQLQVTLLEQIAFCSKYEAQSQKIGDILAEKHFQAMKKSSEKDLQAMKSLSMQTKSDWTLPKFHFEMKQFSIVQANPDLGETEMEVQVVRAINLALPSGYSADQLDTYVVIELPFPNDAHQHFTSDTVKHTNSPVFNSVTKFEINLKSRVFQRVVRSKQLKAEIFYKKGFLQRDKLLGASILKLEKLEENCTIHESLDITENRKVIGGKLEIKVRTRSSLSSALGSSGVSSETIREKWLVFGGSLNSSPNKVTPAAPSSVAFSGSIDVLKFEVEDLNKKLKATQGNVALTSSIKQKISEKNAVIRQHEDQLKSPNSNYKMAYLQMITKLPVEYNSEAKKYLTLNSRDKAQISITKKKIVENEIDRLKELIGKR